MKREIFGIPITIANKRDILEEIKKYLRKVKSHKSKVKSEPLIILTPNPEIIAYSLHDRKFKEIVAEAQINIPDGTGIVWALQKLYGMKIEKIAGADFMRELSRFSAKNAFRIGLIGGRGKVALRLAECLKGSYNNLRVEVFNAPEIYLQYDVIPNLTGYRPVPVLFRDPFNEKKMLKRVQHDTKLSDSSFIILHSSGNQPHATQKYFQNLAKEIIQKKIDILFVALGHPKQEYFIHILNSLFLIHNSKPIVLMAVGGSFDYLSGRMKRAPLILQRLGLEWLYRFIREPWRFHRQLHGAEFFYRVLSIRNPNTS